MNKITYSKACGRFYFFRTEVVLHYDNQRVFFIDAATGFVAI